MPRPMHPRKPTRQCFILDRQLVLATPEDEVEAIYRDMAEFGVAEPPVPEFDVIFDADLCMRPEDELPAPVRQDMARDIETWKAKVAFGGEIEWFVRPSPGRWVAMSEAAPTQIPHAIQVVDYVYQLLVVALATRNAVKTTREHKAATRHGIGRYSHTTTITIGSVVAEGEPRGGTHASPRPHLRRGHPRRQHYGPGREQVKRIFVPPTFVNAEEGYIEPRRKYLLRPARLQ